jgi:Leucine Rich Repeat (LRR) protein
MNEQPSPASKGKRRWLRFGLRSLLVLVTLAAAGSAWLGWRVSLSRQEEQAIARLASVQDGRSFNLLYDNPLRPGGGPGLDDFLQHGPKWLTALLGTDICRTVTTLQAYAPGNEFALEASEGDGAFRYRRKYVCGFTEADMREVAKLSNLRSLGLEANPIDDRSVIHLMQLRQLEWLNLAHTKITDDGVKAIADLPNLRELDLSCTDMTGKSLDSLANCKALRTLNVRNTQLSKEQVQELRRRLPACKIED